MKLCSKCKMEKEFHLFGRDLRLKSGFCSWCKACVSAQKIEKYKDNPLSLIHI